MESSRGSCQHELCLHIIQATRNDSFWYFFFFNGGFMCLRTDLNYYPVSLTNWAPVLSEECDFNQFMAGWWREVLQTDQSKTYGSLWRTRIKWEAVILLILLCFIDLLYGTLPIQLHYLIKKGSYQFAGQLLMQEKKKKTKREEEIIYIFLTPRKSSTLREYWTDRPMPGETILAGYLYSFKRTVIKTEH